MEITEEVLARLNEQHENLIIKDDSAKFNNWSNEAINAIIFSRLSDSSTYPLTFRLYVDSLLESEVNVIIAAVSRLLSECHRWMNFINKIELNSDYESSTKLVRHVLAKNFSDLRLLGCLVSAAPIIHSVELQSVIDLVDKKSEEAEHNDNQSVIQVDILDYYLMPRVNFLTSPPDYVELCDDFNMLLLDEVSDFVSNPNYSEVTFLEYLRVRNLECRDLDFSITNMTEYLNTLQTLNSVEWAGHAMNLTSRQIDSLSTLVDLSEANVLHKVFDKSLTIKRAAGMNGNKIPKVVNYFSDLGELNYFLSIEEQESLDLSILKEIKVTNRMSLRLKTFMSLAQIAVDYGLIKVVEICGILNIFNYQFNEDSDYINRDFKDLVFADLIALIYLPENSSLPFAWIAEMNVESIERKYLEAAKPINSDNVQYIVN